MLAQLFHGVALDLPDAFGGHAVVRGKIHQRGLLVRQPAGAQDVAAAIVQRAQGGGQLPRGATGGVRLGHQFGGIGRGVFQVVRGRGGGVVLVVVRVAVEGHIPGGETAFHARHFGGLDAEFRGDSVGLFLVQPVEFLLAAAQVEEQLALRFGGGDLHDAPVAKNELVHLGFDPMHGEGHQTHAHGGVETLDRFHQPDVAFLDEVRLGQAVAGVATRQVDDEAQVAEHQFAGGVQIVVVVEAFRQRPLIFGGEHRERVDGVDVGFQIAAWGKARERKHVCAHDLPRVTLFLPFLVSVPSPFLALASLRPNISTPVPQVLIPVLSNEK